GAIDPRVTVAVPAVMVSTAMQGGCTCENACLLRIGTGNVEFAALFAPKPMGMTAAKDWTEEMITKGYPELQKHWALHGKPENVKLWSMVQFPHNYNAPSREKIYAWFNEHFGLGHTEPIKEREYPLLTREQMSVWDEAHPAPPSGPEVEKALLQWWGEQTGAKLNASPEAFQEIASKGWETIIGRAVPDASDFKAAVENAPDASSQQIKLQHSGTAETVSIALQKPKSTMRGIVLWLSAKGSTDRQAAPGEIGELLDAGLAVATPSLIGQGGQLVEKNQRVKNPRESAAYTYGYNHPLLVQRVHDATAALVWLKAQEEFRNLPAYIVARSSAAPIGAILRAHAPQHVQGAALDVAGFRFSEVADYLDANFVPGATRYGDVPGLLKLAPVSPILIQADAAAAEGLHVKHTTERTAREVVDWLKETALRPVTP
ncbi:MAG: hypothetical protein ACO1QR_07705, partial [Chthoniobacteraceae bacterium]